ncbi:MAG: pantetheine-phosphate adenylyltransferase [Chloroflexi bacterium CFX4]|nr:pantetheine-phosphate adenylyltransferase [Chloroflexi bacterium CFX4]MDL1922347.1 pantetheine-phosphate adenylyltransferase [Chloroflexi bacterium CFX3]
MSIRRAVYPGSFDPAHYGHIDIVTRAARVFDEVIVAVYANPAKAKSVLFSVDERVGMLRDVLGHMPTVKVAPYYGLTVDYVRQVGAMAVIRGLRVFSDFELEFRMALANRRLAPEIEVVTFIADERHLHISSSTVREIASLGGDVSTMVPPIVTAALTAKFKERHQNGVETDYMTSLHD